ncbi:MAG TPA: HD domain-containing phosphohydrolase [Stellaceae bacterium]|nr:HD domain-containing phosphohydrolase [Stellaceae bacterium]
MKSRGQFPLYGYIGACFMCLLVLAAGAIIFVDYRQTKSIVLSDSATVFELIGGETRSAIELAYDRAELVADQMAAGRAAAAGTLEERLKSLPFVLETLKGDTNLSAVYLGYANGDMFLVRPIGPRLVFAANVVPPVGAVYLVQSVTRDASGNPDGRFLFYDAEGGPVGSIPVPSYQYDPRTRPWYKAALAGPGVRVVPPYIFYSTGEIGASFVRHSASGDAVAAVDVTLEASAAVMQRVRPSPAAEMTIFNGKGEILLASGGMPPLKFDQAGIARLPQAGEMDRPALAALAEQAQSGGLGTGDFLVAGYDWQSYVARFDLPGEPLYFGMAVPRAKLLMGTRRQAEFGLLIALLMVVPLVPLVLSVSQIASRPLRALIREAELIRRLKFDPTKTKRSPIAEIDTLAQSMATMKATIRRFIELGSVLAGERQFDKLLERILTETARVADARGGAVYLAEPKGHLSCAVATFDDTKLDRIDLDPAADADHPAMRGASGQSLKLVVEPDQLARWFPGFMPETPLLALGIPLRDRRNELAGVLVLFQEPSRFADAEEGDIMTLIEAVSGNAAVAIETQRLMEEQKLLLEAVIELIASAIDAKSPYTGKHCQRVPVIAKMIAEKAVAAKEGPFASFSLTDAQWEELHLAAWLHDCGKVLTPEYVVDKATKLETICDRLHEIRMRFEVVKREAEVACWKAIADGADRTACLDSLAATWAMLDEEFTFVASCNIGGEAMSPDRLARLRRIAERTWTRTLDDRIGISRDERKRKVAAPAAVLPATEKLLENRPDQVIEREGRAVIGPDNPWGIRMDVPKHLYDRGEIYNLSIERGTLTEEERFKINEHVIDTIRMLERLPLPRHLRNAIEIAGGHHERIDGRGYPKQLVGPEMSMLARVLAVADVFEALTAGDRPYKRRLLLSEAVSILAHMRDEGHIDPDIFELFLTTGIYREYAEQYLDPEQADAVDIDQYLRKRHAA